MAEPATDSQQPSIDPRRFDFESLFDQAAGEPLPDDGPGNDRTDEALKSRTRAYGDADDLQWLMDGTEPPDELPEIQVDRSKASAYSLMTTAKGVAEMPRQALGGVRDAAQAILNLGDALGEENVPLGGAQIFDKEGNFDPKWLSAAGYAERGGLQLPEVGEAETAVGGVTRAIAQFIVPYAKVAGWLGKAKTAVGAGAKVMTAGAITDFAAFEGDEQRLSNLIQSVPALQNPVNEYLAADPADSEAEGRMKNAVEGLVVGPIGDLLFRGLRAFKSWRALRREMRAPELQAEALRLAENEQVLRNAGNLDQLGDASQPLVTRIGEKARAAVKETETGVPDDVAARALTDRGLEPLPASGMANQRMLAVPEEIAAERRMDIREVIKYGDHAESPFLTADGQILKTHGDHLDFAELLGEHEVLTAQKNYGLIRFHYGDNPDGRYFSGSVVEGQMITPQQTRVIERLMRAASDKTPGGPNKLILEAYPPNARDVDRGAPTIVETGNKQSVSDVIARFNQASERASKSDALKARGLAEVGNRTGVYVNFARIDTPEDIQKVINDTAQALQGDIDKARRGVRTNKQTKAAAQNENAWRILMERRTGEPLNAEQSVAARELWATSGQKLGDLATLAAENPSPENLFQFRRMLATHHAIQKEVIAARTETARALQSWRIPVGGNLERMRDITESLDRFGGPEVAASLARRIAKAAQLNDGGVALSKLVEKGWVAKTLGTVQEYWINALLSGPKTHIVNMASNSGVVALSVIERGAAARLGRLFSDEGVEAGEAMAQVAGLRGGIIDAFRNAGKAAWTGESGFGLNKIEGPRERYISSGTWGVRSDTWAGRGIDAIGSVVNVPGRLLVAEDEFFKSIGYRMELHSQAHRMAMGELRAGKIDRDGLRTRIAEILDDPPEAIRMEAVAEAAYRTFTSEPGKFTKAIQRMISQVPALKFILPFVNTPSNILKYTFERTPLAPLSGKYRQAIAAGGADADLARTKMALGTMAIMYAVDLGLQGRVTGSGPENTAEKQNWRRQGNQPYAVKVGDKTIAYNRLDPLGYTLGIGADLAEFIVNSQADGQTVPEFEEAFAAAVFSVIENASSKSYLQGLSMLTEAVNEPKRFAPTYFERFAGSFVPSGVAEAARFIDPVQRQSNDIITAMKRRMPGFSEDLPPRRDLWGREIRYESGLGKGYDMLSPLYGSHRESQPIDKVMEDDGWFIGMGGAGFTVDGNYVSLKNRPDIKNRFYQLRGGTKPSEMGAENLIDSYGDSTLLETLNAVVTGEHHLSAEWETLETPEDREEFTRDIVRDYYEAAKVKLYEEFPWIAETAAKMNAVRPVTQ